MRALVFFSLEVLMLPKCLLTLAVKSLPVYLFPTCPPASAHLLSDKRAPVLHSSFYGFYLKKKITEMFFCVTKVTKSI